ncbi:MAG: hypothetical protein WHU94_10880 [Thermogemmata sp.]|jgi:hypothetical protein|uniref:Uncharacterized protein n=1 Tax=Thermogemmata fonticola TaxID=2755323 RepID=A0A7V9AC77_9BACT|nr:hypothetical protein [Thermogemmata fonticola]MBA2226719.1 hypothetical protein [Thermogemmata fonticola]MCX8139054.1 hypothetical protein [Gemmataceae bacterium]
MVRFRGRGTGSWDEDQLLDPPVESLPLLPSRLAAPSPLTGSLADWPFPLSYLCTVGEPLAGQRRLRAERDTAD